MSDDDPNIFLFSVCLEVWLQCESNNRHRPCTFIETNEISQQTSVMPRGGGIEDRKRISWVSGKSVCNTIQEECAVKGNSRAWRTDLPKSLYKYSGCTRRSKTFQHRITSNIHVSLETYVSFLVYFIYLKKNESGVINFHITWRRVDRITFRPHYSWYPMCRI